MIAIPTPIDVPQSVRMVLQELLRRAPDTTVKPLFIDWKNQLVGIGTVNPYLGFNVNLPAAFDQPVYFFNAASFQRGLAASGDVQVAKNLAAGSLIVAGATRLSGLVTLNGGADFGGGLFVFDPTRGLLLYKDLTVFGNIIGQRGLSISGDANVSKNLAAGSIITPNLILNLSIYANNAAAKTGGLTAGQLYRNGADPDLVCVVH